MNTTKTAITLALTAALGSAGVAHASENPFGMQTLDQGYQVAEADTKTPEGKCGEGKCGANKGATDAKAKDDGSTTEAAVVSGANKGATGAKAKDGKCGEGKCGAY